MANLNDLIVAIDLSEDGPRVIALVCSREHILMPRSLLYATSWLRHYREVPSRLKKSYLRRFSKHNPRIAEYMLLARVYRGAPQAITERLSPSVLLVDDKLTRYFRHIDIVIVQEKNIRYTHHKRLMLIADNLANYFRVLLRDNPRMLGRAKEVREIGRSRRVTANPSGAPDTYR